MRKNFDDLKPGPIRRDQLPPALLLRVKKVRSALVEVLPMDEGEWIDGLLRDTHPEQEVLWWERVAQCFKDFSRARPLSRNEKQGAFNVIFGLLSGQKSEDMTVDLAKLSEMQISELMTSIGTSLGLPDTAPNKDPFIN